MKIYDIKPGQYSNGITRRQVLEIQGAVGFYAQVVYKDEQETVKVCGLKSFARWAKTRED